MKVLLVHDYAVPAGGAEIMTRTLRDGLRQRGHDARIFASNARPVPGESMADYECRGTTSRLRGLLQTANPWAAHRLHEVIAEFRPDVVHVRMFLTQLSPLILPVLRQVPSIYHVVWYRPICPVGTKTLPDGRACQSSAGIACLRHGCLPTHDWAPLMMQMQLWRRWSGAFNRIVANSAAVRRTLEADGIQPVDMIWNGVPVLPLRPPLTGPPIVAFAGRLVREKGVDVLLHAFQQVVAHVPEAHLMLCGDGPQRAELELLISQLDLQAHVTTTGHLSRNAMEHVLAGAWVQAVPSRWAEPFGIVAAEAMMRGTAVVASRSGGLADIVQDGQTGTLVAPDDASALAEALLPLLQDRALAEQMGQRGRALALAQFSEDACVQHFIRLYQEVIGDESTKWITDTSTQINT